MHLRLRTLAALAPSSLFRMSKPVTSCRTYAVWTLKKEAGKKEAGKKETGKKEKGKGGKKEVRKREMVKKGAKKEATKKDKRKGRLDYIQHDLKDADRFSLVEAMRYIRAMEVGRNPTSVKYDLAVKLKTPKTSPVVKSRILLPTPVRMDRRVCVIAAGKAAEAARKAGAAIVGTDEVFERIREGKLDFDLCLAHEGSLPALLKSSVARILGPRGLMPSPKLGTVVKDPASAIRDLVGKADYRERAGVVRLAIGQLGFTEAQLAENIKKFLAQLKKELAALPNVTKSIYEVILSSTNASGFSLNGQIEPTKASGGHSFSTSSHQRTPTQV